jgi:hypothetical protein
MTVAISFGLAAGTACSLPLKRGGVERRSGFVDPHPARYARRPPLFKGRYFRGTAVLQSGHGAH